MSKFVQISEAAGSAGSIMRPEPEEIEINFDPVMDKLRETKNTLLLMLESQGEVIQEVKRICEKLDVKDDVLLRSVEQKHLEINDSVSKLRQKVSVGNESVRGIEGHLISSEMAIRGVVADELRQLKALYVKVMASVLTLQAVTLLWIFLKL